MKWADLLDDMEARLGAHARALREGTSPPEGVVVPRDIEPLPAELVHRARRLLEATGQMEAEVEARRDALSEALTRAARSETREPAAYVDARA